MPTPTDYVSTLFTGEDDPNKLTVGLTVANKALEQGYSASVILMVEAVTLGREGAMNGIDIGAPFKPAADLLAAYLDKGGKVLICGSCAEHNGVLEEDIDSRFEIITANDVVTLVMEAKGTLQLT